ncbi:SDR family oxidoreductase [Hymenobacter terrenus]|uniref:SDR family oxidoreductase n=1 Tax=Hymenobacter terrenus TaxID=1629124 RepID=UPI00061948DC|nr:NmrA family NAD(P)-binding protein [Hymenobacter terrenus]
MSTSKLKVLVYGATGSQGSPVVRKLLERGHTPYVLTRDSQKAAPLQAAGAQVVTGDVSDRESLQKASQGMDAVALMTPVFTAVPPAVTAKNAIDAAVAAGVPLIVWNTGGKPSAANESVGNPLLDHQQQTTAYLQASGIPHIILQPTVYLENLLGPYTAPFVANENRLAYPHPADMQAQWLASDDLGALMVAALERPHLDGSRFEISGPERLDGAALAEQFSRALGRPITYYAMPPLEFGAILNQVFGPGAGDAVAKDYQMLYDFPEQKRKYLLDMQPVLEKLPVRLTSVQEWVAQHAVAFAPAR